MQDVLLDRPPRDVLVLCNPYAGTRDSRHIYNTQIKPIFERARYNIHHAGNVPSPGLLRTMFCV